MLRKDVPYGYVILLKRYSSRKTEKDWLCWGFILISRYVEGYSFSKEGIRKEFLFCQKWYLMLCDPGSNVKPKQLTQFKMSGRVSAVVRALACRAGGRGFYSRGRANTQGPKITEK